MVCLIGSMVREILTDKQFVSRWVVLGLLEAQLLYNKIDDTDSLLHSLTNV